ncbi:MAG TPA: NAD(P)-dependent oxidoreductase [Verrucomicrobiae bacterium]
MSDTGSRNLNSKYAWQELACQGLPQRSAVERAADFLEIYGLYDEATAREQASRCIQCPNPTCVTGCPLCNPIPQWMQLTAEGRFLEAAAALGSVTNLAEICTRVCPSDHLCEESCILSGISEPVSIRALEQFLIDYAFAHGQVDTSTAPPNGLKIAVAGSGPGGLACAEELAKRGYAVTVFDSSLVPGGLLVDGIPAFKVERSVVQRRIEMLKKRGLVFRLGAKLWDEVMLTRLRTDFDAVFLGFDSRQARPLEVPGANLKGVIQAVPFLLQQSSSLPLHHPPIDVRGRRVVVLGGGDTAMDCLRAAIRYGAREAICVYRRGQEDMSCGRNEYQAAVQEGARFLFTATPVEILGDDQGSARTLRLARTILGPASPAGAPRPFEAQRGDEFELEADLIVLALGFDPQPLPGAEDFRDLRTNEWGGVIVDEHQMTSLPGVFAGGDLVRGPTTLLYAVRDGRSAAEHIHIYFASRCRGSALDRSA